MNISKKSKIANEIIQNQSYLLKIMTHQIYFIFLRSRYRVVELVLRYLQSTHYCLKSLLFNVFILDSYNYEIVCR